MSAGLPRARTRLCSAADALTLAPPERAARQPLMWSTNAVGIGVLQALYEGRLIKFDDSAPTPSTTISGKSDHLVICEEGEPLSEVIAANYAFALGAGLHLIPEVDSIEADDILEAYYSIDDNGSSQADTRQNLLARLRGLCGDLDFSKVGSVTFFTRRLPFGIAFPSCPSTHLFTYPDLGITIINGFAAEQSGTRGVNVAVLVDPEKTRAPEIEAATKVLPDRRIFVRGYRGAGASVRNVTEMVHLFPYDLLIFATHCGDVAGYRWTYNYSDSEGLQRELVVDIAVSFAETDDPDKLNVVQYTRFHSLDGIDWNDPLAKAKLHVGTAILDYLERTQNDDLAPTKKESLKRVKASAAMAMHDNNLLVLPRALAEHGSPIIINNACVSWHQLSERFICGGARAYVGTLYPVSDLEAESIVVNLLGKQWGKCLPHALWSAQNATYGTSSDRRPYVVTGVYPQRLRVTKEDVPVRVMRRMLSARDGWKQHLTAADNDDRRRQTLEVVKYYEREIEAFHQNWFSS
ncbi:hypothetical protein BLA15816_01950 [Burkholderia lata]|nr:hypothetical protein BLA15816_01950 [Burkholderia lata]